MSRHENTRRSRYSAECRFKLDEESQTSYARALGCVEAPGPPVAVELGYVGREIGDNAGVSALALTNIFALSPVQQEPPLLFATDMVNARLTLPVPAAPRFDRVLKAGCSRLTDGGYAPLPIPGAQSDNPWPLLGRQAFALAALPEGPVQPL